MSHQFETGFFVRQPAWHGLGTVIGDYPGSVDEARRLAGLDWDPTEEPAFNLVSFDAATGQGVYEPIEGWKQIKRSDNGMLLAMTPRSYKVVDNAVPFEIAEAVIAAAAKAKRDVKYETAISLDEGRRTCILVNLGDTMLPGDPSMHSAYMFIGSSHDRSQALRGGATDIRVVCANTEAAADDQMKRRNTGFTFNHTRNIDTRIEQAAQILTGAWQEIETVYARARQLLSVRVTAAQRDAFVRGYAIERAIRTTEIRGKSERELMEHPRILKTIDATVAQLEAMIASPTCDGIRDTAYGLTSAAIELLDHGRPTKNAETLFTRTMLEREPHKALAYSVLAPALAAV